MKKQTLRLLLIGNLCMTFKLFASPIVFVPDSLGDFLKGFGMVLVFSSLLVELKLRRKEAKAQ